MLYEEKQIETIPVGPLGLIPLKSCEDLGKKVDGCGFDPWPCSVGERSGIALNCGVGCRHRSDLVLLCLWCRPVAQALIP